MAVVSDKMRRIEKAGRCSLRVPSSGEVLAKPLEFAEGKRSRQQTHLVW